MSDSVNEATLDLLRRRIADEVEERVRQRLFRVYAIAGTAVAATVAFFGWSMVATIKAEVTANIERTILARANESVAHAAAALSRTEAAQDALEKLRERQWRTLDLTDDKLRELGPKSERLTAFAQQVDEVEARFRTLRTEADNRSFQNSADIETVSAKLSLLAGTVDRLAAPALAAAGPAAPTDARAVADAATSVAASIQRRHSMPTVYIQFAAFPRAKVEAIGDRLSGTFTVPGEERTAAAAGLFEIRCFYAADCDTASRTLAPMLAAAAQENTAEQRTPKVRPMLDYAETRKPRPGTLEVWYGDRRG